MTDLLEWAIAAHGGLNRWNALRTVSLDLSVGGALWDAKGQTGLFANASYEADIHRQRATLGASEHPIGGFDSRQTGWSWRRSVETCSKSVTTRARPSQTIPIKRPGISCMRPISTVMPSGPT
jgi:hypothetical protein